MEGEREDVLDLYAEAYDPLYPTVYRTRSPSCCTSRPVRPCRSNQAPSSGATTSTCEYVREGTADLFVMVEPLAGWRHVAVTDRRTRRDFAECVC
jgi:hypothetical protein